MPNANWSNPTLTSTYTNFVSEVKNRDEDLALQFDGTTSTNIPTGTIRWDSSANRWKKWTGAAWGELTSTYALTALTTTGSVGIGTSSPGYALHVSGINATTSTVQITTSATSDATVRTTTSLGTFAFGTGIGSATKCWNVYDIDNSVERLRIDSSGRVGIGTTSPGYVLDVVSDASAWGLNIRGRSADNIGYIRFSPNSGATPYASIGTPAANSLGFETNGAERLRIDSSGRVGIGTTSPGYALDTLAGSGSAIAARFRGNGGANNNTQIRFYGNNAATDQWAIGGSIATNDTGRDFHIYDLVANANRFAINSSGNVGIGTTPAAKLDIKMSGAAREDGVFIRRSDNPNHQLGLWTGGGVMYFDAVTDNPAAAGQTVFRRSLDTGSSFSESARIDSSGRLLVGTTSTTDPALLQVNGDALVNSLNAGPLAGARNRIINGGMQIDQRNSGASISSGVGAVTYSVDRWYVYATGAAVSAQRVTSSNSAFTSALRISGAASNTGVLIGQRIELQNSYDLAGKTVTLSFYAASSASVTLNWKMYYAGAANDFTTKTQSNTGTQATTSTLTKYSATFTLSASATTGVCLEFELSALTSGSVDITGVQLELGSVSTPFERRSIGAELELCQRYFALETTYGFGYTSSAGNFRSATGYLPVNMRVTPTVGVISATGSNVSGQTAEVQSYRNVGFFTSVLAAGAYTHDITFTATAEL